MKVLILHTWFNPPGTNADLMLRRGAGRMHSQSSVQRAPAGSEAPHLSSSFGSLKGSELLTHIIGCGLRMCAATCRYGSDGSHCLMAEASLYSLL
jgi:hypothetical protein